MLSIEPISSCVKIAILTQVPLVLAPGSRDWPGWSLLSPTSNPRSRDRLSRQLVAPDLPERLVGAAGGRFILVVAPLLRRRRSSRPPQRPRTPPRSHLHGLLGSRSWPGSDAG